MQSVRIEGDAVMEGVVALIVVGAIGLGWFATMAFLNRKPK